MPFQSLSLEQFSLFLDAIRRDTTQGLGGSRCASRLAGRLVSTIEKLPDPHSVATLGSIHKGICGQVDVMPQWLLGDLERLRLLGHAPCGTTYLLPRAVLTLRQAVACVWKLKSDTQTEDFTGFSHRVSTSGLHQLSPSLAERARARIARILGPAPSWDDLIGRAGPGAVAERYGPERKWSFDYFPTGVPASFFNWNDNHERPDIYGPGITRVLSVPKDMRSRRYISSEPSAFMYAQLAIMDAMDARLRYSRNCYLHDQARHRSLMYSPNYRTIDLSDASDYVSLQLIESIFPDDWMNLMSSARSSYFRLPDGSLGTIKAFAPMGSGLCFHTMTLALLGVLGDLHRHFHVYGDDIICHHRDFDKAVELISDMGLVVNSVKSCRHGYYVESCGLELSLGIDVTPVSLKSALGLRKSVSIPAVGEALRLERRGFENTASVIKTFYPRTSTMIETPRTRWNPKLFRLECYHPNRTIGTQPSFVDGYDGMFRWISMKYTRPPVSGARARPAFGFSDASSCPWCEVLTPD